METWKGCCLARALRSPVLFTYVHLLTRRLAPSSSLSAFCTSSTARQQNVQPCTGGLQSWEPSQLFGSPQRAEQRGGSVPLVSLLGSEPGRLLACESCILSTCTDGVLSWNTPSGRDWGTPGLCYCSSCPHMAAAVSVPQGVTLGCTEMHSKWWLDPFQNIVCKRALASIFSKSWRISLLIFS